MVQLTLTVTLALAAAVLANPRPITPDPNGDKNIGNGQGKQFITGACLSNADCQSTCCAFIAGGASTGICSGLAVANTAGKAGCGFTTNGSPGAGDAATTATLALIPETLSPTAAAPAATGAAGSSACVDATRFDAKDSGTGQGKQFITGQCQSKADCASNCCVAQASGPAQCKAPLVAQEAGQSCDFVCTA